MTTYLKELIEIPERVHKGDFVLRLTEGVTDPEGTLEHYVVTPALVDNFDHALALIRSAVKMDQSKAAYLHGSFGSGKSHFMAVLYLLLRGETAARKVDELAPVLEEHGDWLQDKSFLMVPYHLIGAKNLESAILGGYVRHVRRLHPDAPLPAVYLGEGLFDDARNLRQKMGDEKFFADLGGENDDNDGGWGELGSGWDADSFEAAASAGPDDPEYRRLVGDLIETYFPSRPHDASETGAGFTSLDSGLSELSRHAQGLGYDGLILFLDELILWLASHAGDISFLTEEGQKLSKLVESAEADRPVPIISLVARQRDLRELVGEHVPGAEKLSFDDILRWWEGRFDTITLENRNLPTIIAKRLLKPKDENARKQLDEAFEETTKTRQEILEILQGREANRKDFRRLYPFSPALVETLVAVSSVLQRERTALKLLLQLLVNQRNELELGDLVPAGDLFDVLEEGDEPFTQEMRRHFDAARRIYRDKLRPVLEQQHDLAPGAEPPDGPKGDAFRADDRLVKTLLIGALAPEADPLKALTPLRLAALNHGTIRAPLPGQEAKTVLQKCRSWAQEVGEVKIGEGSDPTITLQLTGVDIESILEKARSEDNQGNRRRKLKDLLFDALGISRADELFTRYEMLWRGTKRQFDVIFGNVRDRSELPDESLQAEGSRWKLVLDFPFDPENRSPSDDIARIQDFEGSSRTVCWIPSFFSRDTMEKLGRLVILDHVLAGERFQQYSNHLSAPDRQSARTLLENQQAQLRQGLRQALEVAYGAADSPKSAVDEAHSVESHLHSLQPGLQPRPAAAPNMSAALENLADQLLRHQFPGHPKFLVDREIKTRDLKQVWSHVEEATQERDGRIRVEGNKDRQLLKSIAKPLQLGEMHEAHFILRDYWVNHVRQDLGGDLEEVTVGRVREALDRPDPMGLRRDLQDLLVRVYALQTGRGFIHHGSPVRIPMPEELPDDLILRKEPLPDEAEWNQALERAAQLFGITLTSQVRTAGNVSDLAAEIDERLGEQRESARSLVSALDRARKKVDLPDGFPRLGHAKEASRLLSTLAAAEEPADRVRALGSFEFDAQPAAVAKSLSSAPEVAETLRSADWAIFEAAWSLGGEREARAHDNRDDVREALQEGELAIALGPRLHELRDQAAKLLAETSEPTEPKPPEIPEVGARTVDTGNAQELRRDEAIRQLDQLRELLEGSEERRLTISWSVTEPDD